MSEAATVDLERMAVVAGELPGRSPVSWARPVRLRRSHRPGTQPGPDSGGDGPRLPQERRREWRRKVKSHVSCHRLLWYVAVVVTLTLLVAMLQFFAGVHT